KISSLSRSQSQSQRKPKNFLLFSELLFPYLQIYSFYLSSMFSALRGSALAASQPRAGIKTKAKLSPYLSQAWPVRCMASVSNFTEHKLGAMPPNYVAKVGDLETFDIPSEVTGSPGDIAMGHALVDAWRRDGILQVAVDKSQKKLLQDTFASSKRFFSKPHYEKASCVDTQSYAGYIASGEEITDGIADYSEIFTVTKDLDLSDPRVQQKWPCHGPCPWPDIDMKLPMTRYMDYLNTIGERLLKLIECGLNLGPNALTQYTQDGWHHMRILRFPATNNTNGKGKDGRGIGSHTDYGLLVIASQDEVGGLFIRPPYEDEKFENWKSSTAGFREHDDRWVYVPPVPDVFTVFTGDMMQYLTNSYLPSTPHKVGLNTRERYAFAYFHEPSFQAVINPLPEMHSGKSQDDGIHYGTHFTNMFMRNYPERVTSKRLIRENRVSLLDQDPLRSMAALSQTL
ncbi:hypothetical protein Egran_01407, partial [Elaphomyces granulatus]